MKYYVVWGVNLKRKRVSRDLLNGVAQCLHAIIFGTNIFKSLISCQYLVSLSSYDNGEEEHCLELWDRDGNGLRWNDTPCSFETYYICEL